VSERGPLRLFLDSNVLTGGIVAPWGLDKAVLSLCAARICRMVLAEIVRHEIEDNLLHHAAALPPQDAEQVLAASIDLQKMNWKFRTGVYEQTGVSLKEPLPNNPRGAYTREHQDTGK